MCSALKRKAARKATFQSEPVDRRSGSRQRGLWLPTTIRHKADTSEAEEHHGPGEGSGTATVMAPGWNKSDRSLTSGLAASPGAATPNSSDQVLRSDEWS